METEKLLVEEVLTEDFIENKTVDTLVLDTRIEDVVLRKNLLEEFVDEEIADVEFEVKAVFREELLLEKQAMSIFIDSVFSNIEIKNSNNEKITDTIIANLLVKNDIVKIDSTIFPKDELHMDTIASIRHTNEITDDSLTVAENITLAPDTLKTPVFVENVNVEVIYLDTLSEDNQVSDTLDNKSMYYIVLNYFKDMKNAEIFFDERKNLYDNLLHLGKDASSGTYMVGIGPYKTENEAQDTLDNMWIRNVRGWIIRQ